MLKLGDKVRFKDPRNGRPGEHTVSDLSGRYVYLNGDTARNSFGGWDYSSLELIPNPPLTDQELADKYRVLRDEAHAIAAELTKRGYSTDSKNDMGYWRPAITNRAPVQFRFKKTTTTTITI